MELTLWTYEGPPHVGAMRVASSMKDIHYVLHAPQGDTYADLLFTMIERRGQRPPVTYTTFQARDLGGDTAELVKRNITEAVERFKPKTLLVGESCTAELIQDQPGALAKGMGFDIPIVNLELPAYSKKENWGASETFYQLVRNLLKNSSTEEFKHIPYKWKEEGRRPRVNLLGPSFLLESAAWRSSLLLILSNIWRRTVSSTKPQGLPLMMKGSLRELQTAAVLLT